MQELSMEVFDEKQKTGEKELGMVVFQEFWIHHIFLIYLTFSNFIVQPMWNFKLTGIFVDLSNFLEIFLSNRSF
jgi:hypothetical protein